LLREADLSSKSRDRISANTQKHGQTSFRRATGGPGGRTATHGNGCFAGGNPCIHSAVVRTFQEGSPSNRQSVVWQTAEAILRAMAQQQHRLPATTKVAWRRLDGQPRRPSARRFVAGVGIKEVRMGRRPESACADRFAGSLFERIAGHSE